MLAQLNHLSHKEHTMDGFLLHLEEFLLLILLQNSQPAAPNMSFKDGNLNMSQRQQVPNWAWCLLPCPFSQLF